MKKVKLIISTVPPTHPSTRVQRVSIEVEVEANQKAKDVPEQ